VFQPHVGLTSRAVGLSAILLALLAAPGLVVAQDASPAPAPATVTPMATEPPPATPSPAPAVESTPPADGSPAPAPGSPEAEASAAPVAASDGIAYEPPHDKPGPAAERLLYTQFDVDRAPLDIEAGNMDLYLFGLKTEAAQDLADAEGIELIAAPATSVSLILNPAPAPEGELNPFSIPEVRRAMQYLVDRDAIAQDIYRGAAEPMTTHVARSDPDYLTVYETDRGSGITYDPELGRELIAEAMTAAGAELVDGRWHYQGEPIRIKLVARVEDERRDIADLLRTELEAAGFEVAPTLEQFATAVQRVYSTDPQAFEWHIYTEGWGRGAPERYDVGGVNSFNAPWLGNMPGWREEGFWQYENEELDELGQTLFRGEFDSQEQRDEIYRSMTAAGLDESIRIWLVTVDNSFPAVDGLEGETRDIVAGPRNPWFLREAYVPGSDDVRVGHQWVWTNRTTYNPVGGFGDVYSVDLWRNLYDPPLWNDPFSGIPQPFRATYEVETAGPTGTLEVPDDAVMWDVEADAWVPVEAGTTAVSKVTFDYSQYLGSNWHHGQPITLADAMYGIAAGFERSYDPEKARIETALAVTARPYLETIKGYRITDDDRIEAYVDYWHFDEDHIASYATPTGFDMPWEVKAAMDKLVFEDRRAAYSDTAGARFDVPWLSLVNRQDAGLVDRTLRDLGRDPTIPAGYFDVGGRTLVTPEEATARYEAAQQWYDDRDHLVISNGPFYLQTFDPPAQFAELLAFRDPTYPFKPGDRYRGQPPALGVEDVTSEPVVAGEDAVITATVSGPGTLGLRYLLLDPALGEVVTSGAAEAGAAPGEFQVTLPADVTGTLFPGFYELYLAATSDELAQVSERRVDLEVAP
jgi:peptide/nickel transport system substrate-binding protein